MSTSVEATPALEELSEVELAAFAALLSGTSNDTRASSPKKRMTFRREPSSIETDFLELHSALRKLGVAIAFPDELGANKPRNTVQRAATIRAP